MIYNVCRSCFTSFKLSLVKCSKCGSIQPKPEERVYRVVFCHNGKQYIKQIPLKKWNMNLSEVKRFEIEYKSQIVNGEHLAAKEKLRCITFNEVFALYIENYKMNRKKCLDRVICTYNHYYKNGFKNFGIEIASKPLSEIKAPDIERFKKNILAAKTRRNQTYSPQTLKNVLNFVSILFNFAINKGHYEGDNPFNRVEKIKSRGILVEYLKKNEIIDLLKVLNDYEDKSVANIIKFLLFTGLRKGEVFKLKWSNVDFAGMTVSIIDPKGGVDVCLPMLANAVEVLKSQWIFSKHSEYVFPAQSGKMRNPNHNIKEWYEIRKLANINIRLHSLRHTFATSAISSGVQLTTVQKLLTHKNFSTTLRYAHVDDTVLRKSVTQLNEFFENIDETGRNERETVEIGAGNTSGENVIKVDFAKKEIA